MASEPSNQSGHSWASSDGSDRDSEIEKFIVSDYNEFLMLHGAEPGDIFSAKAYPGMDLNMEFDGHELSTHHEAAVMAADQFELRFTDAAPSPVRANSDSGLDWLHKFDKIDFGPEIDACVGRNDIGSHVYGASESPSSPLLTPVETHLTYSEDSMAVSPISSEEERSPDNTASITSYTKEDRNENQVRPPDLTCRLAALVKSAVAKKISVPPAVMYWGIPVHSSSFMLRSPSRTNYDKIISCVAESYSHGYQSQCAWDGPIQNSEAVLMNGLLRLAESLCCYDQATILHLNNLLLEEANPEGTVMQRLVFYFLDALGIRAMGTGMNHPAKSLLLSDKGHTADMLLVDYVAPLPGLQWWIHSANSALFDAVFHSDRIHIIDLGLWGIQWPPFFSALASRPGGPPAVRYTAVASAGSDYVMGFGPIFKLADLEGYLMQTAAAVGVTLLFEAVHANCQKMEASVFRLVAGETLVVNCGLRLSYFPDSSVVRCSPRDIALQAIREMSPEVVTICDLDVDFNGPFFIPRLRSALNLFWCLFDANSNLSSNIPAMQQLFESAVYHCEIVNVVACEGSHRFARSEPLEQWQGRMIRAGYTCVPILNRSGYSGGEDAIRCAVNKMGCLLYPYKGLRCLHTSAWSPAMAFDPMSF